MAIKGNSEDFSYAGPLKRLRENIALPELEIQISHVRRSANGGLIIEISGENKGTKADRLKDKIEEVLGASAKVLRPCVKGEMRLIGMDNSIVPEEVADVVAAAGGCGANDAKVGTIRSMSNGCSWCGPSALWGLLLRQHSLAKYTSAGL